MTKKLYDNDSHLKEFTATVIDSYEKADGYFTVLDKTAFLRADFIYVLLPVIPH